MDDVSNEGKHGDAAVLDLGLAEEADGGLVARAPEVGIGKAKGIVEADGRVEVLGERLEVSLLFIYLRNDKDVEKRIEVNVRECIYPMKGVISRMEAFCAKKSQGTGRGPEQTPMHQQNI